MPPITVTADGGDVVAISEASAASSGVLSRLPSRDADEAPVAVPFSAEALRSWDANAPDGLVIFEGTLSVMRVRAASWPQALCACARRKSDYCASKVTPSMCPQPGNRRMLLTTTSGLGEGLGCAKSTPRAHSAWRCVLPRRLSGQTRELM